MILHKGPISGIAVSEKYVATAGYDNQLILWKSDTKESVSRAFHDHLVNSASFSADGKWIVSSGSDCTARVFRVPDLQLVSVLADHDDDVEMSAFSPSGEWVATASRDGRVRLFERSGKLLKVFCGHTADVISVSFDSEGKHLVSSSDDGTIRTWNLESGREVNQSSFDGVETDTLAITNSGLIYAGNDMGEIIAILPDGSIQKYSAHDVGIKRLVLNESINLLVSVSYDRTCKVWSYSNSGANNGEIKMMHHFELLNVVWPRACAALNATTLVFGTFGTSYATYDLVTKEWDARSVMDTYGKNAVTFHNGNIYTIGDAGIVSVNNKPMRNLGSLCNFLTPFGSTIITGGQIGKIYDALTGEVLYEVGAPLNCAAAFIYNQEHYAVVGVYSGDLVLLKYDKEKNKIVFVKKFRAHENAVKGVAASNDHVFSVSANREAQSISFASLVDGESESEWKDNTSHTKIANGCVYMQKNSFASISRDRKLRIWNAGIQADYQTPHQRSVKCISFDPVNQIVATGSYGGEVALFDVSASKWLKMVRPTTFGISSICNTPNGFVASSYDGAVYEINRD